MNIYKLANQVGCESYSIGKRESYLNQERYAFDASQLEAFANLIAAKAAADEREQCAKICEENDSLSANDVWSNAVESCAKLIRER